MGDFAALDKVAASQYGVVTSPQLARYGFTLKQVEYRVKSGQFRRLQGRVVALAGTSLTNHKVKMAAAALAASPEGCGSHRTAATLFGFRTVDQEVDVSIRYPRKLHLSGVDVHRSRDLMPGDITWVEGIPVTTPERTICDLGLIFPESEVMRILRHAVATGFVSRRDVLKMRIRIGKQGRNGAGITGRCLESLPEFAEETESGLEVRFLEMCEKWKVPRPHLQHLVVAQGRRYRLDFAYPLQRVFVEVDGVASHSAPEQIAKDGGRQNDLVAAGWQPIRFDYLQLKHSPSRCAQTILQILNLWPSTPDSEG